MAPTMGRGSCIVIWMGKQLLKMLWEEDKVFFPIIFLQFLCKKPMLAYITLTQLGNTS